MLFGFFPSSNPIALKLLVYSFILRLWLIESSFEHWSCYLAHISGAPFNQCLIVYVFLKHTSLYHLIWQMLSLCSHNCGNPSFVNLDELSLIPPATSSSSHWFTDELLFRNWLPWFISRESSMSSRQFVSHLFSSSIVSLRYPNTDQIWISVRYDGWNIFPRVITLVFYDPVRWWHAQHTWPDELLL